MKRLRRHNKESIDTLLAGQSAAATAAANAAWKVSNKSRRSSQLNDKAATDAKYGHCR